MLIPNQDDGFVDAPTEPEVGPPIPGKQIGAAPQIAPDGIQKVVTANQKVPTAEEELKARALHRAIQIGNHSPWPLY